jgi:tRNA dimethylallyltransferase
MIKGIMIGGPTGIGKTDLAVALAQRLGGELISCDSVQVYEGLSIGANKTATPVPQHLLDVVPWCASHTAADFVERCWAAIREIVGRGRTPILVGGTGFYLDWILYGRPSAPATDPAVLAAVEAELATDADWDASLRRLQVVDAEYASIVMRNDYYRLKRALVVHRMTGQPLSSFKSRNKANSLEIDWRCFYLTHTDRRALMTHLDARCETMVQRGLVKEVVQLKRKGFTTDYQAGRAIGYKETLDFLSRLAGKSKTEERDQIVQEYLAEFQGQTRQYTRRQEKWFAAMPEFRWLERGDLQPELSSRLVEQATQLYEIERDAYLDPSNPLVSQSNTIREQCRAPQVSRDRRKRLRTYRTVLCIYADAAARKDLLETQIGMNDEQTSVSNTFAP